MPRSSFGKQRPRLADVQCSRLQFLPGDKIVVRLQPRRPLWSKSEIKGVKKMVEKWVGDSVDVLVVDTSIMDLEVVRGGIDSIQDPKTLRKST